MRTAFVVHRFRLIRFVSTNRIIAGIYSLTLAEGVMEFFYYWLLVAVVVVGLNSLKHIKDETWAGTLKILWHGVVDRPVLISISVLIFTGIVVAMLNASNYSDPDFIPNLFVEAHGMLLDILVFGVLILLLNRRGEKRVEERQKSVSENLSFSGTGTKSMISGGGMKKKRSTELLET